MRSVWVLAVVGVLVPLHAWGDPVDVPTARAALAVLQTVDRAARARDEAALRRVVRLPLAVSWTIYDMEVRVRRARLRDARSVVRRWRDLAVPQGFFAASAAGMPRTGGPLCGDGDSATIEADGEDPLWRRGGPAVERVDATTLRVTFARVHCDAQMHYAVWTLARDAAGTWAVTAIETRDE